MKSRTNSRGGFSYRSLEPRQMLTSVILNNGQIQIAGDATDNTAIVALSSDASTYVVLMDGDQIRFDTNQVDSIRFRGWNGNDQFVNQTSLESFAFGGLGNDILTGGTGIDELFGDDGDDILRGRTGNDTLNGGEGNDEIFGSFGADLIDGGSGNDELVGGAGLDQIIGGPGADTISGGIGADVIFGGSGDDSITGGSAADWISGGLGDDNISGLAGADTIFGDGGNDLIFGGAHGDVISGGQGNDNIYGGQGNDLLDGSIGADRLYGGEDRDTLQGGAGIDRLIGGASADQYFASAEDFIDLQAEDSTIEVFTFVSQDTPIPLPDRADVTSTVTVSENVFVTDVNVVLDITHTYTGDLNVMLTSPAGTTVQLFQREGGSGNNFSGTILDDEATVSIIRGSAPFSSSFRPENPLSTFDGEMAAGVWSLRVIDELSIDRGVLNSWSLVLNNV